MLTTASVLVIKKNLRKKLTMMICLGVFSPSPRKVLLVKTSALLGVHTLIRSVI
ncbi:hypothetical protein V6Z12_D13G209500 [Gossypium hirsutum]